MTELKTGLNRRKFLNTPEAEYWVYHGSKASHSPRVPPPSTSQAYGVLLSSQRHHSPRLFPEKASLPVCWPKQCLAFRRQNPVGNHPLTFTPTLAPLNTMREKISLVTGLDRTFQHGTDSHAQCASCFLTSVAPFEVKGSAYPLARTLDHIVADHIGKATPYPTLELSCNDHKNNIESIYFDNMSWYATGHVAPSMRNPRKIYDRPLELSHTPTPNIQTSLLKMHVIFRKA